MDSIGYDIRQALRGFARAPGFVLAVIVTLALGIGATTTMFGVLDVLLLRPPEHVRDADRVVRLYVRRVVHPIGPITTQSTSVPGYESLP